MRVIDTGYRTTSGSFSRAKRDGIPIPLATRDRRGHDKRIFSTVIGFLAHGQIATVTSGVPFSLCR